MSRRPWGELVLLGLGAALLFPCQAGIDRHRGAPLDVIQTLPPERLLPTLAFGHRETAADLLEIRATNFMMRQINPEGFTRPERDHLWILYGAIQELDPHNPDAMWRGTVYLSSVADRPRAALELTKRALGEPYGREQGLARQPCDPTHPRRWRLYYERAAIHLMQFASRAESDQERHWHVRESGRLLQLLSELPGAPDLASIGERLQLRGLSDEAVLEHSVEEWTQRAAQGDALSRAAAELRLREARCGLRRLRLQREFDARVRAGRFPASLDELNEPTDDPLGSGFFLRPRLVVSSRLRAPQAWPPVPLLSRKPCWLVEVRLKVVSAAYEAAHLERLFLRRLPAWRKRFPSRVPTPGDLGQRQAWPPYLEFQVVDDKPRVRARPGWPQE